MWTRARNNSKCGLFHWIIVSCLLVCCVDRNAICLQTYGHSFRVAKPAQQKLHTYICYRRRIWSIEMRVKPYERMWKVIVIALIVKVHEPVWIVQQNKKKPTNAYIVRCTLYKHNIKWFKYQKNYRMLVCFLKAMPYTTFCVYIGL